LDWSAKVELFEQIRREYEVRHWNDRGRGQEAGRAPADGAGSDRQRATATSEENRTVALEKCRLLRIS
jgi:hypothetical protein